MPADRCWTTAAGNRTTPPSGSSGAQLPSDRRRSDRPGGLRPPLLGLPRSAPRAPEQRDRLIPRIGAVRRTEARQPRGGRPPAKRRGSRQPFFMACSWNTSMCPSWKATTRCHSVLSTCWLACLLMQLSSVATDRVATPARPNSVQPNSSGSLLCYDFNLMVAEYLTVLVDSRCDLLAIHEFGDQPRPVRVCFDSGTASFSCCSLAEKGSEPYRRPSPDDHLVTYLRVLLQNTNGFKALNKFLTLSRVKLSETPYPAICRAQFLYKVLLTTTFIVPCFNLIDSSTNSGPLFSRQARSSPIRYKVVKHHPTTSTHNRMFTSLWIQLLLVHHPVDRSNDFSLCGVANSVARRYRDIIHESAIFQPFLLQLFYEGRFCIPKY